MSHIKKNTISPKSPYQLAREEVDKLKISAVKTKNSNDGVKRKLRETIVAQKAEIETYVQEVARIQRDAIGYKEQAGKAQLSLNTLAGELRKKIPETVEIQRLTGIEAIKDNVNPEHVIRDFVEFQNQAIRYLVTENEKSFNANTALASQLRNAGRGFLIVWGFTVVIVAVATVLTVS